MAKKIVVAVGSSLRLSQNDSKEIILKEVAHSIVDLIESGYRVIITHGNSPQIGKTHRALCEYDTREEEQELTRLADSIAMTQGYIGMELEQAIRKELHVRNKEMNVVTLISHVVVDAADPAFAKPTKAVGAFLTKEQAEEATLRGETVAEVSDNQYRRVVSSPEPREIIELKSIEELFSRGHIVITCGGGGIPVVRTENNLRPVSAVVEKDFTAAKLAVALQADILLLLTSVDKVFIHYNTPEQQALDTLSIEDANRYIMEGHFASTSMLPKVQAAVNFASTSKKAYTIIAPFDKAADALKGDAGTIIN